MVQSGGSGCARKADGGHGQQMGNSQLLARCQATHWECRFGTEQVCPIALILVSLHQVIFTRCLYRFLLILWALAVSI